MNLLVLADFNRWSFDNHSAIIRFKVGQAIALWLHAKGGKSGLHRAGCQVTPGRRESTESATENIPPVRALSVVGLSSKRDEVHR